MKKALYWELKEDSNILCRLCPHQCLIDDGKTGRCRIRLNKNGVLYAKEYGRAVSYAVDPIEKKPLYHFYPSSQIFSLGANGCNFSCDFCQNWQISQEIKPTMYISPDKLISMARQYGCSAIAYTYTEPLIWFEYVLDCAKLSRAEGIKTVLVTNGYICEEPAEELLPFVDALNIDLKSMNPDFYRILCGAELEPVKNFIKMAANYSHIELTNLIIPTQNDSDNDLETISKWVAQMDKNIALHFSAYSPRYKMEISATPVKRLLKAYEIAKKHLNYVYLGNVRTDDVGSDTICPNCGNLLISRSGYTTEIVGLKGGVCADCSQSIPVIMDKE
ncbi:AmmeMemoRadiSam system radical SAM enzyme [bacterium]|nr:AmmeMemoRadiSam system radical SAM enzyme [bacterium]